MKPIVKSMQIKNLFDMFCIANGLKQGDALLPLLFTFDLEYAFQKGPRKACGTHQLLVYADDVVLLVDNTNTIKRNTEALTDSNKVGLEASTEKTKNMLMSFHQNAEQNHSMNKANRSLENVATFKYFWMTLIN
jgi:hypothetical protein